MSQQNTPRQLDPTHQLCSRFIPFLHYWINKTALLLRCYLIHNVWFHSAPVARWVAWNYFWKSASKKRVTIHIVMNTQVKIQHLWWYMASWLKCTLWPLNTIFPLSHNVKIKIPRFCCQIDCGCKSRVSVQGGQLDVAKPSTDIININTKYKHSFLFL